MPMLELVPASKIYLTIPGIKLTSNKKIAVGQAILKNAHTAHGLLYPLLSGTARLQLVQDHPKLFVDLSQGLHDTELRKLLYDALAEKGKRPVNYEAVFGDTVPVSLNTVRVITDALNIDNSFMYDPDTERAYPIDRRYVLSRLKQLIPDDDARAKWMADHSDERVIRYCPYKPKTYEDRDGRLVFNKWSAPSYMIDFEHDAKHDALPEDFVKVFTHTFPIEKERHYILGWMRAALFDRATVALVLTGFAGCGKGVFSEHIMSQLVGSENWTKAPANFSSSAFHGDLRGRMVYLMNEMVVDLVAKEKLKGFVDGTAALNEKNQKVAGTEPIHASFIIANNSPKHNRFDPQDRKFYVPRLNEDKLDDKLGGDWVDNFCEVTCKDPAFLRQLSSYLFHHVKPIKKYPKTEMFHEICELCLHPYLKKFIAFCKNRSSVSDRDLSRLRGKQHLDFYEFKQMLLTYEKETKTKIADLIEGLEGWSAVSHICTEETRAETAKANADAINIEKERVTAKYANGKDHGPKAKPVHAPYVNVEEEEVYKL